MNILLISTTEFKLDGITNVILNYYRAMDKEDLRIDFVFPNKVTEDFLKETNLNGSCVFELGERIRNPIWYMLRLSKIIKQNKYDIVHAHGNSSTLLLEMYAAKSGGAKVRIPHSHNTTSNNIKLHYLLRKAFYKYYTHGFACGEDAGRWLYNKSKFTIINNGIDIDKYKYNKEIREIYRNKYSLSNNKVIGHVGNFNYQKNHEFLINIFNELYKLNPVYKLLLIGDGEKKRDIEEQVERLGLSVSVIFIGKSSEVPQLMQAMDILVMPSRFEGLPLTLIEAQAACLSCFVSDEITQEVNITNLVEFISLKNTPEYWAEYINKYTILNRESRVSKVYDNLTSKGYNIKANAEKLKNLYQEYIKQ